jgi:CRISPR-associated protein Cmr1
MAEAREWQFKALTSIWTGHVTGIEQRQRNGRTELRETIDSKRLITTGLLGSIRWWFEVLVRGLDGSACDPSDTKCQDKNHCVVCELFGCTGWARKFRFQVLAETQEDTLQKDSIKKDSIKKDDKFRLRFQPLREIEKEEWALLGLTLRLIADYGAIGGKTVYKPSDENARRNAAHHRDYGIVSVDRAPEIDSIGLHELRSYVGDRRWRCVEHDDFAWASLASFWSVTGRYLARQDANRSTFNRVIGRHEGKDRAGNGDSWLAGRRPRGGTAAESKKVFSFKNPARTFGFFNPGTLKFADIKNGLKQAWPDLKNDEILKGEAILKNLTNEVSDS